MQRGLSQRFIVVAAVAATIAGGLGVVAKRAAASPTAVQIATDPLSNAGAQHQTVVEPVTAAWGTTIVSTYQVGRYAASGSGAAATGWSTSTDAGATWTSGLVPSITTWTSPPGIYDRAVNMTVAYDRAHGQFILATLGMGLVGSSYHELEMFITRSSDGINWSTPTSVVNTNEPDKDWIVCDNTPSSPFYGRCYITYSADALNFRFEAVASSDGGLTWSAPVATPANSLGYNVNPVVRPDGHLVVVATNSAGTTIVAYQSTNGGATFSNAATIAPTLHHDVVGGIRDRPKPSIAVDAAGRVYTAWFDCAFRSGCTNNDIVWIKSDDGVAWSGLQRVDVDPLSSTVDHFIAGLGVKPGTAGATAQLDLVFFQMPNAVCSTSTCAVSAVTTTSVDGGATWSATAALNSTPMVPTWMANTNLGRMLSDYNNVAYLNGVAITTVPVATTPAGATTNDFRQALYFGQLSSTDTAFSPRFSMNCAALSCNVDASASSDPNGVIVGYQWDFGAGGTATGDAVQHVFPIAGAWPVTLTVTDNHGATASITQTVTTGIPTDPGPYASDAFSRTVANGWGTADLGGKWTTSGTAANASVANGVATHAVTATGATMSAALASVASTDTDLTVRLAADKSPSGTGQWSSFVLRHVNSINEYRVRVKFGTSGMALSAIKLANSSTSQFVGSEVLAGLPATGNQFYRLHAQVIGVNPTVIRARLWLDGQSEPSVWKLLQSDSTATIQAPGSFVLSSFDSGTPAPVAFNYDDIVVGGSNQYPVVAFNRTCPTLSCGFDASPTHDPDGTVVQYDWSFGDGATATGVSTNHTYATAGTYTTTLTATDDRGSQVGSVQTFAVVVGGGNSPPIASFSSTCTALSCTFDASASNDPDGAIASYAWSYSDGATSTGLTGANVFAIPGVWPVTLTVTDNLGASASVSNPVATSLAPQAPTMQDAFARTINNGWGNADVGGPWSITGIAANFATTGGIATQKLTAVNTSGFARLLATPLADADVQIRVAADQMPVGTGYWLNVIGRSVSSANEYRARVRFASNGVFVGAYRVVNGSASVLIGSEVSTGLAMTPGQFYRVRMNVNGTNPTTIKIKVWLDGANEPTNWLVSQTDASPSVQAAGAVGISTWIQGTTPLPLTFSFDDLVVRPGNQAPIPAFSSSCVSLACTVDGTSTSDPDGVASSYAWSFGDGATASGATPPAHSYAASGTYVATLTVTDDKGAQASLSQFVVAS